MNSIWDLANPQLRDLAVYEPGKPIEETARELGVDPKDIVKLASNENPIGPSPKAIEALRNAVTKMHFYPDGGGFYLRNALAEKLKVAPDQIILGNGSNEVIEFLSHAFLNEGDNVITSQYAFIAYKIIAKLFDAQTIEAPSLDFQQDVAAMIAAITPRTRIIYVANPNNPTGSLVPQKQIDELVSRVPENVVVVFDEAYFEFLDDPPRALEYIREHKNVVILRTFSKIHGLAGLRVGYGIAHAEMIQVLQKAREPFNTNSMAQIGALAALNDTAHLAETKRVVDEGRAFLENEFSAMKLRFVPAAANFVMVNVGDGPAIFQKMLEREIIVRPLKGYGLAEWIRISVGTMEQNEKCIAALREVLLR